MSIHISCSYSVLIYMSLKFIDQANKRINSLHLGRTLYALSYALSLIVTHYCYEYYRNIETISGISRKLCYSS